MPLYWLCYRHNNQISVGPKPGPEARMKAAISKPAQNVTLNVGPVALNRPYRWFGRFGR